MIVDAHDFAADHRLDADIAIVGGGPAGITLAHELMGSGLSVVLLEAGGLHTRTRWEDSFRGEVVDSFRHPTISLYRARGLGGTSTLWGGRCVPFDPIDLEERPHIPWSGWPLSYAELKLWYHRAVDYCETGPFRFRLREALGDSAPGMVPGLEEGEIESEGLERFSRPTDFGRRYRKALAGSSRVTVILSAQCVGLRLSEDRGTVQSLLCASGPERRFTVRARRVVLAAGALETTRLMLASGAGNGLTGRFYMCHVEGKAAVARFRPGLTIAYRYERDGAGVYFRRFFTPSVETQRRLGLTNVILRFEPPIIADPAHRNPVLSAMWLSRTFLKAEYQRKMASFGYRSTQAFHQNGLALRHVGNVVLGAHRLAAFGADWIVRHVLAPRKLPYVAVRGNGNSFTLDYNAEQVPNPDSRVGLGGERDALGLPRLVVDWRATPQDIDSVIATHRLLAERLKASGTGELAVDEDAIRNGYNAAGGHHIGTARMADGPDRGVVDRNGQVFGMDNLFVAGAATFPTCSHANPTLTLVALSARLADHLKRLEDRLGDRRGMALAAE
jgi:Choline dehydrogenase and related flavoproteins